MTDFPRVAVIILNFNGTCDTLAAVNSVLRDPYPKKLILVVDNASDAKELEYLENSLPGSVTLIKNTENLGFAAGNNTGMKRALSENAEFMLVLNNDTECEPGFLQLLVDSARKDTSIGIVSPLICFFDQKERAAYAGGTIRPIAGTGIAKLAQADSMQGEHETTFCEGSCMLLSKRLVEETGGFDEKYFLYLEDTDLSVTAARKGYRLILNADSRIYHKVGATSDRVHSDFSLYYVTRNRLYFTKKLFPGYFWITASYILVTMALKSVLWILTGRFAKTRAVAAAIHDFFSGITGKSNRF